MGDSVGHQVADAPALGATFADVGGGDLQRGHVHHQYRACRRLVQHTRRGRETRMVCVAQRGIGAWLMALPSGMPARCTTTICASSNKRCPFMPGVQLQEGIAAHQQAQRLLRTQLGAQRAQRVHAIAGIGAVCFAFIQSKAALPCSARRTMAVRCCALACGGLRCGGVPLGMKRTLANRHCSSASCARRRWPLCMGSKVPPRMPMGAMLSESIQHRPSAAHVRQRLRQIGGEARGRRAIDHAVVVGQRQRQHQARHEFAVLVHTGFMLDRTRRGWPLPAR